MSIRDKYSFDLPAIDSEEKWLLLVNDFLHHAEKIVDHVRQMDEKRLYETFVKEEYGTYLRNIEGQIEHAYYHLGQISLIKKLLSQ